MDPLSESENLIESSKMQEYGESGESDDDNGQQGGLNSSLSFLGPTTFSNSDLFKVHYNTSPYAYVMNNPVGYIDLFGLDSTKQLPAVTVTAQKPNSLPWLGPMLIGLGQPINFLKPFGALGSKPGSSIASFTLSKVMPGTFTKLLGKKVGRQLVKKIGTNVIGRALGRWVPYLGIILTAVELMGDAGAYFNSLSPQEKMRVVNTQMMSGQQGLNIYYH